MLMIMLLLNCVNKFLRKFSNRLALKYCTIMDVSPASTKTTPIPPQSPPPNTAPPIFHRSSGNLKLVQTYEPPNENNIPANRWRK